MALAIDKGKKRSALGSVTGMLAMSHSFGVMSGALFGGIIMEIFGIRYIFIFNGLFMLMGVLFFAFNSLSRSNWVNTQNSIAVFQNRSMTYLEKQFYKTVKAIMG